MLDHNRVLLHEHIGGAREMLGCRRKGGARGYPVTSASLPRSRSANAMEVYWETIAVVYPAGQVDDALAAPGPDRVRPVRGSGKTVGCGWFGQGDRVVQQAAVGADLVDRQR